MYVNIFDIVHSPSFLKHNVSETGSVFSSGEQKKGNGPTLVRPLEKANLFHWKTNPNLNAVYVLVAS
jgi:hypothetical protein